MFKRAYIPIWPKKVGASSTFRFAQCCFYMALATFVLLLVLEARQLVKLRLKLEVMINVQKGKADSLDSHCPQLRKIDTGLQLDPKTLEPDIPVDDSANIQMSKQECDASWSRMLQFQNCKFGLTSNAGNLSFPYDQCPEDHLARIDQCALLQPGSAKKDLGASKFISHPRTREHIDHICHFQRSYLFSMISPVSNSNILEAYGTSHGRIYRTFETCVAHWTKYNLLHVQGNTFPPSLDPMPIHLPGLDKPELMLTYRTIPFYIIERKNPNQEDIATTITVATMGSIDKLERLVRLCSSWPDRPISFVLYTTNVVPDLDTLEAFWNDHALELAHVTVHVFISSAPDAAPLNFLRNLAMEGSSSDYVFALDVDFIPSPDTPTELDTLLPRLLHDTENKVAKHVVLVIPAFQRKYEPDVDVINLPLPQTKSELMKNLGVNISTDMLYTRENPRNYSASTYQPFHVDYYRGHGPTDFEHWYKAAWPYRIQYEYFYEPYVVINRFLAPRYWEMFRGFGLNKQTWLVETSRLNFRFTVVPRSFLIHVDHNPEKIRTGKVLKQKAMFSKYIKMKYRKTPARQKGKKHRRKRRKMHPKKRKQSR